MKKKIMIVDDDLAILEVMRIILEENNYEVIAIADAQGVDKKINETLPDLILLDIWMSGFDGRDVVKELKSNYKTEHIPVVMVSANNDTEQIAKEAGADGFLAKPFDISDLLAIAARYIH